jgi:acyl carrier protein
MNAERSSLDGIAASVERFIRLEGAVAPGDPDFSRSVDLLDAGYLDSLGIVHLIAFIEQEFSLPLSDEVLADQRIATIHGIASILDEQMRGVPGVF